MSDRGGITVMVAMDNNMSSEQAWQWYLKKYHRETDFVLFVHAAEHGGLVTSPIPLADSSFFRFEREEDEIFHFVDVLKEKLYEAGVNGDALRISDITPGKAIIKASKKYKADLIIIGNQRHGPFHKFFHGSVNQYVRDHSDIPVISL